MTLFPTLTSTLKPTLSSPLAGGGGGGPVVPGMDNYLRPASTDKYRRPDGTSTYKRP